MAEIYTKLTDKTLILAPREAVLRQFNFGTDWTEMRLGCFATSVTDSGDNTNATAEGVTITTAADRIAFGIKNADTTDLPGFAGSLFLGVVTPTGNTSNVDGGLGFFCGAAGVAAAGYDGVTLFGGTNAEDFATVWAAAAAASATGYNGFFGLKLVINNRGLSTQTITMSVASGQIAGTDYSASALRTELNNASYSPTETVAWNDGAAARAIPDCYYLRMPFFNNRIRISAIRAIRYLP